MNWHKTNSSRTSHKLRNRKAHIVDGSRYGFFALCGQKSPAVTLDEKHSGNPENNVCKRCQSKLTRTN